MAPTKRNQQPAHLAAANLAKKAKKESVADKVVGQQLKELAGVLERAPIGEEVKAMLTDVLPSSLGEFSDKRHKFQEQVVEALAGILEGVEVDLKKTVSETRSKYEEATSSKPAREQEATEAETKVVAAKAETHRLKVALAQTAIAFRSAQQSVKEAEEVKVVDAQKSQEASKKKGHFETAAEDLKILQTLAPEEARACKKLNELVSLLKKYKFEESMLIALPAALAKAPEARGQFDLMAINQLEAEIGKMIAEEESILAAAKPGREKCEAAVKQAQEKESSARFEQREAAKKFDSASEHQAACEDASSTAQNTVRSLLKSSEHLKNTVYAAEVEVELFQQGPKDAFQALRSKTTPAPVVEEVVVDEPAMETQEAEASAVAAC